MLWVMFHGRDVRATMRGSFFEGCIFSPANFRYTEGTGAGHGHVECLFGSESETRYAIHDNSSEVYYVARS